MRASHLATLQRKAHRHTARAALFALLLVGLVGCKDEKTGTNTGKNNTTADMGDMGGICRDLDGDGFTGGPACVNPIDCDDSKKEVNPDAQEICADGVDNNCDGQIDEDCPCQTGELRLCSSYGDPLAIQGPEIRCKPGIQRCKDGAWGACEGEVGPAEEACNRIDDNCDGKVDEDLRTPLGLCKDDLPPNYVPPGESCGPAGEGNGFDDNGDGQVDEGCDCSIKGDAPGTPDELRRKNQPCYSGPPPTLGVGTCKAGTRSCKVDGTWEGCSGEVTPVTEVCGDQLDNDCDGLIDEGCPICMPTGAETCDGEDNDCDGIVDEGLRNACGGCGMADPTETCNDGLDNNCNGLVDEGCPCIDTIQDCYPGPAEAAGVGACTKGTQQCDGEELGACMGFVLPSLELCGEDGKGNGVDEDCDGQVDEGCGCTDGATRPCGSNTGVCTYGTQTCAGNAWGECTGSSGATEPGDETSCDGLDNDCDGIADEGLRNACGKCNEPCYTVQIDPTQTGMSDDGVDLIPANDPANPRNKPGLTLKETISTPAFLWAANSNTDGASKVDTNTDEEVARYWVGDNPSRTAVDLDGNMWVIGRNDGRVTKIWANESDCDAMRDGNPTLNTSQRIGNNVAVVNSAANPLLDECVAYSEVLNAAHPSGRGVAVDPNGTVWFGYSDAAANGTIQGVNARTLQKTQPYPGDAIPVWRADTARGVMTPRAGETMNLGRIYGAISDPNGDIWAVSLWDSKSLAKFRTGANPGWEAIYDWPDNCTPYGIALDGEGRFWVGCWGPQAGVGVFDPATKVFTQLLVPSSFWATAPANGATSPVTLDPAQARAGNVSAITVDAATGHIWATLEGTGYLLRLTYDDANPANSSWTAVRAWIDSAGNTIPGVTSLGGMRGVGFDNNGYLWHLGLGSEYALKIDPATLQRVLSVPMPGAGGHYTYSDFTGDLLSKFIARRGIWRNYFDTTFDDSIVSTLYVEAHVPQDSTLSIRMRPLDANNNPVGPWVPAESNGPQYLTYPAGAQNHTFDLATAGGPLVGHTFELEVVVTTQSEARPIIYDLRLGWQRP